VGRSWVRQGIVDDLRYCSLRDRAGNPFTQPEPQGQKCLRVRTDGDHRAEHLVGGFDQVQSAGRCLAEIVGVVSNAVQNGVQVECGGDLATDFREGGHLTGAPPRLLVELRVADGDANVRSQRGEQASVIFREEALLDGALHTDYSDGLVTDKDWYTEIRFGVGA
jgi:hypothetical protein